MCRKLQAMLHFFAIVYYLLVHSRKPFARSARVTASKNIAVNITNHIVEWRVVAQRLTFSIKASSASPLTSLFADCRCKRCNHSSKYPFLSMHSFLCMHSEEKDDTI